MKALNEKNNSELEKFDTDVYARTSINNMPIRLTNMEEHTEEEQKEIELIFETAI